MSSLNNHLYKFGDFTIDADQRVLFRAGERVSLTPKVFDTLLILVESGGRIVEKEELKRRLWPDTFVEDANIAFNIQQVRKCLDDDARNPRYVGTVQRRGYRFLAEVEVVSNNQPLESPALVATADGRKRITVFAAALLVLLTGAGFMAWKFSKRRSNVDNKPAVSKSGIAPLKLEQLTATGQSNLVALSPDGKYLAYQRASERKAGVWLRHLEANTNVEVIPPTSHIFGLAFANSGEYLYVVKGDPLALYRVPLVGGVPTKIVDNPQGKFSISADDSRIAFIREAINAEGQYEYSLFTVKSDGTGEKKLFTSAHPHEVDTPMWTPDGATIICSYGNSNGGGREFGLIEVNAGDGRIKELPAPKFFRITKMAWSPQADALILSARTNLEDNNQLWKLTYPGLQLTQLTEGLISYLDLTVARNVNKAAASQMTFLSDLWIGPTPDSKSLKKITPAVGNFCWSADGRLMYTSTASGNNDLWIMNADGSQQQQLTVDAAMDVLPTPTPDNRYIVFISNRTGNFQIWRMNRDGSNQVQLTSGGPKFYPSISGDGKWVFYNTTDDLHAWKISVEGGESIEVAGYVAIRPAMSPDQRTIACVSREGSKHEILILPASGGQPLKRIEVPAGRLWVYRTKWTTDGKALIYLTESDGTLNLMKQSLDGKPPEALAKFDQNDLFDFDFSADGQFAVTRGVWKWDVVLINDLNQ